MKPSKSYAPTGIPNEVIKAICSHPTKGPLLLNFFNICWCDVEKQKKKILKQQHAIKRDWEASGHEYGPHKGGWN